jgi:two-component sensor histidine kinase
MRQSLRSRLVLLLLLANLPAAALAIGATLKAQSATVTARERASVQEAELIATRAGLTLGIAEGVVDTLASNPAVASGNAACRTILEDSLALRPDYVGIVVADDQGLVICSAGDVDEGKVARHSSLLRALQAQPTDIGDTVFLPESIHTQEKTVLAARPFEREGGRGAIGLLIKRAAFDKIFQPGEGRLSNGALALVRSGGIVVSQFGSADEKWRPSRPLPMDESSQMPTGLTFAASGGEEFFYALAPVRGTMTNIVLATPSSILTKPDWTSIGIALLAPLLMLVLGIGAVFAGVDRLVLQWIARLRAATGACARGDYSVRVAGLDSAPLEIADLGNSFNVMASRIEERSHALEEALAGKNGLLRELHHRVKNNFQMIASLLALQRRELPLRLRTLLRVPEDRVLAMASAYKASYATGEIGRVSLLDLLRDIAAQLRQSFSLSAPLITLKAEAEAIWLDLDRAVPLGLLVSEIMSSALDRDDAATMPISITLQRTAEDAMHVQIAGAGISHAVPSMGLAARLVSAYTAQLGARLETVGEDMIRIHMSIDAAAQAHPGRVELGS